MKLQADGQVLADQPKLPWPLFRLAFRPFFLLGALFSIISIITWALSFTGLIEFSPYGGSLFWHAHEMLFGFAVAIISGFLLTAVKNWTGVQTVVGKPLALLVLTWLFARILMAFPGTFPSFVIAGFDLLFLPFAALCFAIPIFKVQQWRNLFFVAILLAMAGLNALMHLSILEVVTLPVLDISHMMVMMVALVMTIMGGRVFPMFTANGTKTQRVLPIVWLEKLSISSVILSVIVSIPNLPIPAMLITIVLVAAGVINFVRAVRWRIWVTLKTPLVWSLHFSYWSVCVGLVMLGLAKIDILANASLGYHAITVGGIGLMILSMISRVSLGHTGRKIQVGKTISIAFILMLFAFFIRVIAPTMVSSYDHIILISALLWAIAYCLYVVLYLPILIKPRPDGGPG